MKTCKYCGKELLNKRTIYCSKECAIKYTPFRKQEKKTKIDKKPKKEKHFNILKYCRENNVSYGRIMNIIYFKCMTFEQALEFIKQKDIFKSKFSDKNARLRYYRRLESGYSEEEAILSVEDFAKIKRKKRRNNT